MTRYKVKKNKFQLVVKAKLSSGENLNERELSYFTKRSIQGLLSPKIIKKFGSISIEYTGPVGISLFDRLKKPISKFDFFFIIEQIVSICQRLKFNSMSIYKIQWDLHNIFINETTREMQFIYLPIENEKNNIDIINFIQKIIYSLIPFEGENTEYISRFVYFIKGMKTFDENKIESFIFKECRTVIETIKGKNDIYGNIDTKIDNEEYYDEETDILGEEDTCLLEIGEQFLGSDDETTLLEEEFNEFLPYLYRVSTGKKIYIDKPVFRVGKESSNSDYCIDDNNAVSRKHAEIINRGQRIFLVDLNSKNMTYINDKEIVPQKEIEIFDGDRLTFADENFIFYLDKEKGMLF